jgi:hypothetical protein
VEGSFNASRSGGAESSRLVQISNQCRDGGPAPEQSKRQVIADEAGGARQADAPALPE